MCAWDILHNGHVICPSNCTALAAICSGFPKGVACPPNMLCGSVGVRMHRDFNGWNRCPPKSFQLRIMNHTPRREPGQRTIRRVLLFCRHSHCPLKPEEDSAKNHHSCCRASFHALLWPLSLHGRPTVRSCGRWAEAFNSETISRFERQVKLEGMCGISVLGSQPYLYLVRLLLFSGGFHLTH